MIVLNPFQTLVSCMVLHCAVGAVSICVKQCMKCDCKKPKPTNSKANSYFCMKPLLFYTSVKHGFSHAGNKEHVDLIALVPTNECERNSYFHSVHSDGMCISQSYDQWICVDNDKWYIIHSCIIWHGVGDQHQETKFKFFQGLLVSPPSYRRCEATSPKRESWVEPMVAISPCVTCHVC